MHCTLDNKEYCHNKPYTKALYNVIRADLGMGFCNLQTRPIVLFILHRTISRYFSKDKRVSRLIPIRFWDVACITIILLKTSGGCNIALDFRLKMTSCACFFRSLLKLILHWKVHLFILTKSLFNLRAEILPLWII